jgi:hypothetical protein
MTQKVVNGDRFTEIYVRADPANPVSVTGPVDGVAVKGASYKSVASFSRPANLTAYTAGDVVGSNTSAIHQLTNAGPLGGFVLVQSVDLLIENSALPSGMSGFRLHLYTVSPAAIVDNASFSLATQEISSYVGFVDLPTPQDMGSVLYSQLDYVGRLLQLGSNSTTLFCELETRGAYTPNSGTGYTIKMRTLGVG